MTPLERIEEERRRLRPLAIPAKDYALKFPVTVGPTAVVEHHGIRYTMPAKTIGFPGTLHLFEKTVVIVAGKLTVEHPRFPEGGRTSSLKEHRAENLAAVSGARGKLVHRHPRTWTAEVEILFDLLQSFGEGALRRALKQAVERRLFGADYVARILTRAV